MKYNSFLILFLVIVSNTKIFAQNRKNYSIEGVLKVNDTTTVHDATVFLRHAKDSTVISYTVSNNKGYFKLEGPMTVNTAEFIVSYLGYKTYKQFIDLENKPTNNLGSIFLEEYSQNLNEVTINAPPPVMIKNDTIIFNVKSFKTPTDANVEDLFRVLQGFEVTPDGDIKVNGKPVANVLVNGKPFFGRDLKIATRNLLKKMIDKVEVTDYKTKEEAFKGEEGSQSHKSINLIIKKENNRGQFGKSKLAYGTDDRYEAAALVSLFNDDQRLSVLGGANNINAPNFSFGDIDDMLKGFPTIKSINNKGILTSKNFGVDYSNAYKKGQDVFSDYLYKIVDIENKNESSIEAFFEDGTDYFTNSVVKSTNINESHSFNIINELELNPKLLLKINGEVNLQSLRNKQNQLQNTLDEAQELKNSYSNQSSTLLQSNNYKTHLSLVKLFKKQGVNTELNLKSSYGINQGTNTNTYKTEVANNQTIDNFNQQTQISSPRNELALEASFSYPITKNGTLKTGVNYSSSKETTMQSTFDYDNNSQNYDVFNFNLSNDFLFKAQITEPYFNFKYSFNEKWRFTTNVSYNFNTLNNNDLLRPEINFTKNFNYPKLSSELVYNNRKSGLGYDRVELRYNRYSIIPQSLQLREFQDISNPLNIIVGNSNLKPTKFQQPISLYINLSRNKWSTYINFNINNEVDKIVEDRLIDDNFKQNITYVNYGNSLNNLNFAWSYNRPFKFTKKTLNINPSLNIRSHEFINVINDQYFKTKSQTLNPNIVVNYIPNSKQGSLYFRYDYNSITNSSEMDKTLTQNFNYQNLSLFYSTILFGRLGLQSNIKYTYNSNTAPGFPKDALYWNAILNYAAFKNKVIFEAKIFDILNQNIDFSRQATNNYIINNQNIVLKQYFLFGASWNFNATKARELDKGSNKNRRGKEEFKF